MARVVVTQTARTDLDRLIRTHQLPASTRSRVRSAIEPLGAYPLLGRALTERWAAFRVVLGPWPWMLVLYVYDESTNVVAVVSIQDSRSSNAATGGR